MGFEMIPSHASHVKMNWKALFLAGLITAFPLWANSTNPSAAAEDSLAPPDRQDVFAQGLAELKKTEDAIQAEPENLRLRFDRLRILFVLGVKDEKFIANGDREMEYLGTKLKGDSLHQVLLLGYQGAFRVVRAKHGFNLRRKWENLQSGIPLLDSAVKLKPEEAEIRYLRLVSNYYLPFFLGRKPIVREDFARLGKLLPDVAGEFPPKWYLSIAGFVMEKGKLKEPDRIALADRMEEVAQSSNGSAGNSGRSP